MAKKVVIAKGVEIPVEKAKKMRDKPGGSNIGVYKRVPKKDFAGPSGGSGEGSFPINTLDRARNALARAHFAPNPSGIRKAVYAKYPQLKISAEKRGKDE